MRVSIVPGNGGANETLIVELLHADGQVVRTADAAGGALAFEALAPGSYHGRAGIDSDRNGRTTDVGDFAFDDTPAVLAAGGNVDVGTPRRAPRYGARHRWAHGRDRAQHDCWQTSRTVIFTFRSNGVVDVRRLFSSPVGSTESNARGTVTVRGDAVTMNIDGEVTEATIERSNGEIRALRIRANRFERQ